MNRTKARRVQIVSVAVFLAVTLLTQFFYTAGPLNGDFSKFMMPSKPFGVPQHLAKQGISPHSQSEFNFGWDGQFHYFMANDLFNRLQTSMHVDNPPYRYQRIGQSLVAKAFSLALGQTWVSPLAYYLVGIIAVALATWFLSGFLTAFQVNGLWSLLWALSAGTQLTLSKGLPDAFADACLIIGVIFFLRRSFAISGLLLSLAVLSREAYVTVTFVLAGFSLLTEIKSRRAGLEWSRSVVFLLTPLVLFLSWQIFLKIHFGKFPSEAIVPGRLLEAFPFGSWWRQFEMSFSGVRKSGHPDEWKLLLSFMGLYIVTASVIFQVIRANLQSIKWEFVVTASLLPLLVLYAFFGDVVMNTYWGYQKAIAIFYFIILIHVKHFTPRLQTLIWVALVCCSWFPVHAQLQTSFSYPGVRYVEHLQYWKREQLKGAVENAQCLNVPLQYELLNIKHFHSHPWMNTILGRKPIYLFKVRVYSSEAFSIPLAKEQGRVTFSMIQANSNNEVVSRGIPTVLQVPVVNQNSFEIEIPFLTSLEEDRLGISFHQKLCGPEKTHIFGGI